MTRKELVNIPGVKNLLNFGKYKGKQYDEHFRKYNLTQANGYTNRDVQILMHKYNMHATQAMDFLEYDTPEYY